MERRNPTPAAAQLAVGNASIDKYNRRLLMLAAATGLILIALMFLTLLKVIGLAEEAKENSREAAEQTRTIKTLVQRQTATDAERQQLIDEAVSRIAAEQYRALVAHDRRVEELIRRNLRLTEQEVNNPRNQESAVRPGPAPIPAPAPVPRPPSRTEPAPVGPPTGVQPQPAPAPAPAPQPAPQPCEPRGKSGKCKR